ncbi:MAG TPA: rRNA maturation RNase YbeY [Anaerolineae bacterium]|nr:rRNA maturation RNase YbeY [Anaerolineae bacterium]MCB0222218.1 rRNA maturation RNase YbeY [Anaerolineae bacterium]MCB9102937.1 rRNA maturation RNase YbeY [Anaerolineales bacterium]HRV92115.1 rRNA maturation RNase YbeY [Anaerolineae bacterium]
MLDALIQIDDEFTTEVNASLLQEALRSASQLLSERIPPPSTLTITITNNDMVAALNQQYRGVNAPTDVLSFENVPDPDFPAHDPELASYLGDVVIAFPVAQSQAEASGHTPQEEITLLAVHGLLHLLGLDHDTPTHKTEMWAVQQKLMAHLGLAHVQPTEK